MDLKKVYIRDTDYEGNIEIDKTYYENTDILDIKNVNLKFSIHKNNNQEDVLNLKSTGIFILEDARNLTPIEYPFSIEFIEILNEESEFCGRFLTNSQNTLDILDILWENIVLEIPICVTSSEELNMKTKYYQVGNESKNEIDPRLAPLMDLLDKEKE